MGCFHHWGAGTSDRPVSLGGCRAQLDPSPRRRRAAAERHLAGATRVGGGRHCTAAPDHRLVAGFLDRDGHACHGEVPRRRGRGDVRVQDLRPWPRAGRPGRLPGGGSGPGRRPERPGDDRNEDLPGPGRGRLHLHRPGDQRWPDRRPGLGLVVRDGSSAAPAGGPGCSGRDDHVTPGAELHLAHGQVRVLRRPERRHLPVPPHGAGASLDRVQQLRLRCLLHRRRGHLLVPGARHGSGHPAGGRQGHA